MAAISMSPRHALFTMLLQMLTIRHLITGFVVTSHTTIGIQTVEDIRHHTSLNKHDFNTCRIPSSKLSMGLFDFLNPEGNNMNDSSDGRLDRSDEDESYVGCSEIFHISAKSIKVGPLKLYLSLYFMGEQNNPERGTWKPSQTEDGGIDLYYRDQTGALIITLSEKSMKVSRLGSAPSIKYLSQEAIVLNGMLDQLDEILEDDSIEEKNRLICSLEASDVIKRVRENLAFG